MDLIDDDGPEPGGNSPEFSVSELSGAVKRVVEGAFDHVRVRGEVGRVSRPRSGHLYLDLKDDRAVLASVCWKGVASRLQVQPEEGMEVIATGRLTTFPGQSRYQLVINDIAPAGVGALMAMLEKRKKALAAEGLFAPERKKPIPYLPEVIGVITSPSGAVIRDIIHRLAERFPRPVLVWPVAVQGKASAGEVANAIRGFNALQEGGHIPRPDVLIVARGGGSVEDLWGFNEEIVARAAAESRIPLISAVGHETDTTLIDYVADRRAPTPTAAAEMAAPVRGELMAALAQLEERRQRAFVRGMEERSRRLRDLTRALPRPDEVVAERRQRLDIAAERLPRALERAASRKRHAMQSGPAGRFGGHLLEGRLARMSDRLNDRGARLAPAMRRRVTIMAEGTKTAATRLERAPKRILKALADRQRATETTARRLALVGPSAVNAARDRLEKSARLLETLSYKATLARGYAVVRDDTATLVSDPAIKAGTPLSVEFSAGTIGVIAAGTKAPPSPTKTSRVKSKAAPDNKAQGALDL
ncbi:MAG: exodeoxyribonuclease VII large subunit [Pikeienuella sp.]